MKITQVTVQDISKTQYVGVQVGSDIIAVSSAYGTTLLHKGFMGMEDDFEDLSDEARELEEC